MLTEWARGVVARQIVLQKQNISWRTTPLPVEVLHPVARPSTKVASKQLLSWGERSHLVARSLKKNMLCKYLARRQ